jgi:formylglycine-generating enzyme required for sulfatase activity
MNSPVGKRIITIKGFNIGVTEVTNLQYREFVNWVRDSIAHATLGHYIKVGDKQYIDWSKKLDWQNDKKLAELYLKGDDQYHRKTSLDNRKLIYSSGKYKNKPLNIYPDTICWVRDFTFTYNELMSAYYFSHPAYTDYPVVGVSWEQALAYCDWKSEQVNVLLRKMGYSEITITLPSEIQWECAATSGESDKYRTEVGKNYFAWNKSYQSIIDKNGNYLANFGPIDDENGIRIKDYFETGDNSAIYCSKVRTFPPYNGMYDLAGNVDEWVLDRAIPSGLNYCFDEFEGSDNLDKLRRSDLNFESFCYNYFDSIFAKKDEAAYRKLMQSVLEEILAGTNLKPYLKKYTLNQILDELTKEFRMLCADDKRLAKGGSWNSDLANVATGSRRAYNQNRGYSFVGFRIACSSVQKIK